jgi:hypothetical protein
MQYLLKDIWNNILSHYLDHGTLIIMDKISKEFNKHIDVTNTIENILNYRRVNNFPRYNKARRLLINNRKCVHPSQLFDLIKRKRFDIIKGDIIVYTQFSQDNINSKIKQYICTGNNFEQIKDGHLPKECSINDISYVKYWTIIINTIYFEYSKYKKELIDNIQYGLLNDRYEIYTYFTQNNETYFIILMLGNIISDDNWNETTGEIMSDIIKNDIMTEFKEKTQTYNTYYLCVFDSTNTFYFNSRYLLL